MLNDRRNPWALSFSITFSILIGCSQQVHQLPISKQISVSQGPLIPAETIEKQIRTLNQVIKSQRIDETEKEMVSDLLSAYESLIPLQSGQLEDAVYRGSLKTIIARLNQIMERYYANEHGNDSIFAEAIHRYTEKRSRIIDKFLYGDYQTVIDESIELEATFGTDALTPEIGIAFACALAKKGMLVEAIRIGNRMLRELAGKPDLIQLRASIIEWQLGLGNREKAMAGYEKLLDDLDERKVVFKKIQNTLISVAEGRETLQNQAESGVDGNRSTSDSLDQIIKEIDNLIARQDYEKAKILLIRRKLRTQEGPDMEILEQAFRRAEEAERISYNQKSPTESTSEKNQLKMARSLIEREKYEEALEWLKTLKENDDTVPDYLDLKKRATDGLINYERNRAAKLFLLARNTTDSLKKKEYLLSAKTILKKLVDKFPLSKSIKKINSNIKSVDEELQKLTVNPG